MVDDPSEKEIEDQYRRPIRRLIIAVLLVLLVASFILWRIQGDRVDRIRSALLDAVMPTIELGLKPGNLVADLVETYRGIAQAKESLDTLDYTLHELRKWKDHAQALEQENASLRKLANLAGKPSATPVSAVVLADTSSPFRHSILINVGSENGVDNGWPVTDGVGIVGRISSISRNSSRVVLLTDTSSQVPIRIQPSGLRAVATGDNSANPVVDLIENASLIGAGDRVVTSGDGGLYPPNYLVGTVFVSPGGRFRIVLAADYRNLGHVGVIKYRPVELIDTDPELLVELAPGSPGEL